MRLAQYLSDRNVKPSVFAQEIGVAPSTITRLLRGERRPRLDLVALIQERTGGVVTAADFMQAPAPAEAAE